MSHNEHESITQDITSQDIRLRRLVYRSWHRGCKETDVILGPFADEALHTLDAEALNVYETLLDEQDADIWLWLTGKEAPERPEYGAVIAKINQFAELRAQRLLG